MGDGVGSTIILVLLLLLVMFGAYFATKFLSAKTKRLTKARYIDVKDRMVVGRDKYIVLLEAGEKVFLVGITSQSINVIGTLTKEEITPIPEETKDAVQGLKGFWGKLSGIVKNAGGAQEELRKARLAARVQRQSAGEKSQEEQDEIDKILSAIQQRKNRTPGGDDPRGGR